jgi:ketosteroid isomerase-like protein
LSLEDERDLDDRVIAIGTATGRGRVNGIVIEFAAALVASFARDGKITRLRIFQDINEALEAVGLAG